MTVKGKTRELRALLSPLYGEGEAKAMIRLIFHSLKRWNQTDMIIHEADELSDYINDKIEDICLRLKNREPIQYILGEAYFYGMDLKVDRSVLIPRVETEELVDMIVKRYENCSDLRVLDIGTGSGAIAIALSRNLRFADVTAIDISPEALSVARENAKLFKSKIRFVEADVFKYEPEEESYDIIVSNPPYIDESEKKDMESNVLDYEPHAALFVPDDNPLIFYSRIIEIARKALAKGGTLWFEINPRHAEELSGMLSHEGFGAIEIISDIHGKKRFISAAVS